MGELQSSIQYPKVVTTSEGFRVVFLTRKIETDSCFYLLPFLIRCSKGFLLISFGDEVSIVSTLPH